MKKILFLLTFFLMTPLCLLAQSSMTDSQIMDYIISENAKGVKRSQIVTNLMQRGVSVDRIRKIRDKYEKEQKGDVMGAKNITSGTGKDETRLRKNNGKKRSDYEDKDKNAGNYRRKRSQQEIDDDYPTDRDRDNYRKRQQYQMEDELDFILPDSLEMFDDIMGTGKREKGRKVFGRNIFNNKKLTFESDMNIATPGDYQLGPGDAVFVDVWGGSTKNWQTTVSPDGNIDLEGYGPVNVGGLTVNEANKQLRNTIGRHYSSSQIKLTVGQTKTITVNVMGEVNNPGTFTLSAFSTIFHALYMAGGTNDIGTLRNIKIFRGGKQISTCDIYDYILNGKMTGNVKLQSGDVIVVNPYEALVCITGKVKRPMYYEMKSNESVGTLIKYAGGFRGDAYQNVVRLIRKSGGRLSVYSIDEFERNGFQLADEDSVSVDSTLERYSNMVEVKGAVFRPGMYQMDGSITTVSQLLEAAGGPTEDAFTNRAVMHRRGEDRTLEVIGIVLVFYDDSGVGATYDDI